MSLLSALFQKRTSTTNLRSPAQWLLDWATGGEDSASGIAVNENTALSFSTVWACAKAISEDVAKLPFMLYRWLEPTGRERVTAHPAYRLLHDQPNPDMAAIDFRSMLTHNALLRGNGYAWIERDQGGRLLYLWPLAPDKVTPRRLTDGTIWYEYQSDVAPMQIWPADQILHIRGPSKDGIMGMSVISMARESIGAAIAAQRFGAAYFGNGANPGGVLEHPGVLSKDASKRIVDSWNEKHKGTDRANKIAILEEGMKFSKTSIPPEDSQFLETRQFSVSDICRWFRVPPHKVGDTTRAQGWSTLEATQQEYVQDSLMPWAIRWEQHCNLRLLSKTEQEKMYCQHQFAALLRADTAGRAAFYASAITNGYLTRNEVRDLEDRNPLEGLDKPVYMANLLPVKPQA